MQRHVKYSIGEINMEAYFDNSATTKPKGEVVDIMLKSLTDYYGNPSSLHKKGVEVEKLVKEARKQLAKSLYAKPEEIIFTSGGTEANNLAILGTIKSKKREGRKIITTKIEHPSVLNVYKTLENEGYEVVYLRIDEYGMISIDELKENLTDDTILVSIMHVNNEVGTIQPIEEIGKILKKLKKRPTFHVDAIQSFGKIKISPQKIGIDLLSVSAHKVHGPKGVGVLYIKKGTKIQPIVFGGSQETGIRSGTENVPGILGFGAAVSDFNNKIEEHIEYIKNFREKFKEKILAQVKDIKVNGHETCHAPHILNISFSGIRGEVLLHYLEQYNIYVSTGSACSSNKKSSQSHVLKSMKLTNEQIEGAIRFSFSYTNKMEEMDYAIEKIKNSVEELRMIIKR
ncbi:cysteine desulfurase family protein [Anaeromicrobium sediminis]|nr:cysteine desulfurase family protein [Anaeromicrobium sediminis]